MALAHSFTITLSNNKTEMEGLSTVLNSSTDIFRPDTIGRKKLLSLLNLKQEFWKTFDLIRVAGAKREGEKTLEIDDPKSLTLIELKTTRKRLPDNPYGFFFGATENEFLLAEHLGTQFQFAFVCLHPETPSVKFITLAELNSLIRTKRIQYQINMHRKK